MSEPSARYRLTEGPLESRVSDDEVVILHPTTGQYFSLDAVGERVWRALGSGPIGLDQLVQAIQQEYDVDEATCRRDVAALLEELLQNGLVGLDG